MNRKETQNPGWPKKVADIADLLGRLLWSDLADLETTCLIIIVPSLRPEYRDL